MVPLQAAILWQPLSIDANRKLPQTPGEVSLRKQFAQPKAGWNLRQIISQAQALCNPNRKRAIQMWTASYKVGSVIPAEQNVSQFAKDVIPDSPAQPGVIRNPGFIRHISQFWIPARVPLRGNDRF